MKKKFVTLPAGYVFAFLTISQMLLLPLLFSVGPAQAGPGELDFRFGVEGKVITDLGSSGEDHALAVAIQADQKIVIAGERVRAGSSGEIVVARYLSDGALDPAFGAGGRVVTRTGGSQEGARALVIQPDGKIVVAGTTYREGSQYDFVVIRYNADGTLDPAFGAGGIVTTNITRDDRAASIALQADGKIVVAGITDLYRDYNTVFAMVRYQADGEVDSGFGENGRVITDIGPGPEGISSVLIQEDQKILAVGPLAEHYLAVARYDAEGVLDPSFGAGGTVSIPLSADGYSGGVRSAALQSDGKMVVAGSTGGNIALYGSNSDVLIMRLNPDGTLDAGFGNGGRVLTDVGKGTDEIASGLVIDRGRMIVGGHIYHSNASANRTQFDFLLLRYLSDGRLDPAFGDGGHAIVDFGSGGDDLVYALSLQANGRIVLAGESVQTATGRDLALARFLNEPIDAAPPVTESTLSPAPNAAGWNHTDVRLTLSASDPEEGTGVKEIRYAIGEGPEAIVAGATAVLELASEGIFKVRYYAVDLADHAEAARLVTVQIDKTGPSVLSSQSPAANPAGWNKGRVAVDFEGVDSLSGGGLCGPASISVTTEGAHQSIQTVCSDLSGNQTAGAREVNIDQTPPVLTLPPLVSTYPLNSTISLSYGADDPLSGVALISAMLDGDAVSNGAQVTFSKPGPHTFVLTATDRAGNSASQSRSFTVGEPSKPSFTFLPPLIVQGGRKVFELGSTIPVKFRLTDTNGSPVSSAVARLSLQYYLRGKPVGAPIRATSHGHFNSGDLFRFNGEHYSYRLNTKPLSKGIWELRVSLSDGSVHAVMIELKSGRYVERSCAERFPHSFLNEGKGDDEKDEMAGFRRREVMATRPLW